MLAWHLGIPSWLLFDFTYFACFLLHITNFLSKLLDLHVCICICVCCMCIHIFTYLSLFGVDVVDFVSKFVDLYVCVLVCVRVYVLVWVCLLARVV